MSISIGVYSGQFSVDHCKDNPEYESYQKKFDHGVKTAGVCGLFVASGYFGISQVIDNSEVNQDIKPLIVPESHYEEVLNKMPTPRGPVFKFV